MTYIYIYINLLSDTKLPLCVDFSCDDKLRLFVLQARRN